MRRDRKIGEASRFARSRYCEKKIWNDRGKYEDRVRVNLRRTKRVRTIDRSIDLLLLIPISFIVYEGKIFVIYIANYIFLFRILLFHFPQYFRDTSTEWGEKWMNNEMHIQKPSIFNEIYMYIDVLILRSNSSFVPSNCYPTKLFILSETGTKRAISGYCSRVSIVTRYKQETSRWMKF